MYIALKKLTIDSLFHLCFENYCYRQVNMTPNTTSAADVNPNENLEIPNWVNQDYFLPIIKNDQENFQKVSSFKSIAATAPGDNYCSVMLRIIIEVELKGKRESHYYQDSIRKYPYFRFDHHANRLHFEDNVGKQQFWFRNYK